MNVRSLTAADRDVVEATVSFEVRRAGLGDDFYAEFRRAVASIGATPRSFPRTEDGPDEPENREFYIARFKHRVVYAIWHEEAVIVAVLDARRRPGVWQPRLTDITPEE